MAAIAQMPDLSFLAPATLIVFAPERQGKAGFFALTPAGARIRQGGRVRAGKHKASALKRLRIGRVRAIDEKQDMRAIGIALRTGEPNRVARAAAVIRLPFPAMRQEGLRPV